ncbi:hypothetical protein N657DRAFT_575820 [Parathielavia appendiculata]|uniref:Uncharacterized protein n=1 Tax=Parathielavia appendiculata TaxID=2587402 RepID=A0AAN6Z2B9_9PEZI|nr:hypothetical protein N657DRAFT_575820 [Parathielavia appendiculata]
MGCFGEKRTSSSAPMTCIVNDAHLGREGVCGKVAAGKHSVCATHLCQYRPSPNGRRCGKLPLRLASRRVYTAAGWYPDTAESVYCKEHEKYNCMGVISDTMRCSAARTPGEAYCLTHAAVMCKWEAGDGRLYVTCYSTAENEDGVGCPEPRCQSSIFCWGHRCLWKADEHTQCSEAWYSNTPGVCPQHMCVKRGCENRAQDGIDRCVDHVCAFVPPPDWPSDFFPCYREPVEGQSYCEFHDGYLWYQEQVWLDAQAGGGWYG